MTNNQKFGLYRFVLKFLGPLAGILLSPGKNNTKGITSIGIYVQHANRTILHIQTEVSSRTLQKLFEEENRRKLF